MFKLVFVFLSFFCLNLSAMIIDNLNDVRAKWSAISDQVMGGISEVNFYEIEEDGKKFYRLEGDVSTENNGGFIQIRTNFDVNEENFNGIRIKARGLPSEYFIHIRTSFLLLPWQYYSGKFVVSEVWEDHEILFEDFEKSNFYQPSLFSSSDIKSIGFVAFGKNFEPQLDILKAELF